MSRRTYIIIAVVMFLLAGYLTGPVFNAMKTYVTSGHDVPVVVFEPTRPIPAYVRFMLPLCLLSAAIPLTFMINQNLRRSIIGLLMALVVGAAILLSLRDRLESGLASGPENGSEVTCQLEQLHLEMVPWAALAFMFVRQGALKAKGKKRSKQDDPPTDVNKDI
ncbi:MAG: hypothetical protein HN350_15690 [Phycisphaerales bacterium]|nr:hypothetical protein [Phycisphaerales bacterium]